MKNKIIEKVKALFKEGRITGFLALRRDGGHVGPHLFTGPEDLEALSLGDADAPGDARYSLVQTLANLLEGNPRDVLAILVRGCDERALERLMDDSRRNPLRSDRVVLVGFSCPPELAAFCECRKPWPDALTAGERTPGAPPAPLSEADPLELIDEWFETSNRCIKCFGCRNICPVCNCKECTVEREVLVPQRELPPARSFLVTRAVHMVDRCVYCGLCELACPADIPLKQLYRLVARAMGREDGLPGAINAAGLQAS
ncbi:MAG: 4Fe-4S binding protein [Proteobacteria bacterium]|nr:4Fe-4S binding protein [Pseudomonadota bacterium]